MAAPSRDRYTVPVHEEPRLHDGIGPVLLAFAVFAEFIRLPAFKVEVAAVVIKDTVIPWDIKWEFL